jgi:hypothetical protein
VKTLLILILLAALGGVIFHDKQQTAELARVQDENAQLTQQLATYQLQYSQLQAKMRQVSTSQAGFQPEPAPGKSRSGLQTLHLQDLGPNPLDRPQY